jgi:hypothetical protein
MHPIIAYQATKERLADWHEKAERGRRKHRRRIVPKNLATVLAPCLHAALTARSQRSASLPPRPNGQGHQRIFRTTRVRLQRQWADAARSES